MDPRSLWNRIRSSPATSGRRPAALLVTSVVAFVAVVAVVWSSRPTVYLEPAGSAGAQPAFIPQAVAVGVPQRPVHTAGQVVSGDALGLYGGTRTEGCDTALIRDFLAGHPDRAQAWAGALVIDVADIPALLASLTPVTLRTDTAVTNHGFEDGHAEPFQSVLQAGTAVLVDAVGLPRVRCFCGNPLQGPEPQWGATYGGQRWEDFEPETVTVIRRAPRPVQAFVVVKEETDEVVSRPRATSGSSDREVDPDVRDDARNGPVGGPGDGPPPSTPPGTTAPPTSTQHAVVLGTGTAPPPPTTSATAVGPTPTTAAPPSPDATGTDAVQPVGTSTDSPVPLDEATADPGDDGAPQEDANGDDTTGDDTDGESDGEDDRGDGDAGSVDPDDGGSDGG